MIEESRIKFGLKYAHYAPDVWNALNELPRTGWVERDVSNPETVQEHTISLIKFAISILDLLPEFSVAENQEILNMLEVHDWPEAITGDEVIVTKDESEWRRLRQEKFIRELDAMTTICKNVPMFGDEIFNLWLRFEEGKDPVSKFARDIDKFQVVEKAFEYELKGENVFTPEFIEYSERIITHPLLIHKLSKIKEKRNFLKENSLSHRQCR